MSCIYKNWKTGRCLDYRRRSNGKPCRPLRFLVCSELKILASSAFALGLLVLGLLLWRL